MKTQTTCLTLLILTVANNVFGLAVGNRIKAASGGANVRDAALVLSGVEASFATQKQPRFGNKR